MRLAPLVIVLAAALLAGGPGAANPTAAQQSAIKSACPQDFQTFCSGVQPGGQAALSCLQTNAAKLSSGCRSAVAAVGGTPPAAAAGPAPAATAPAAPAAAPAVPLSPRQELRLLRDHCAGDVRRFCPSVPVGAGRIGACLKAQQARLTPGCRGALADLQGG